MSTASNASRVIWTFQAERQLDFTLVRDQVTGNTTRNKDQQMAELNDILAKVFDGATDVMVRDQYVGYRHRPGEFIFLVEVRGGRHVGSHVVKVKSKEEEMQRELAAWANCRPPGLHHDLVFMALEPHRNAQGQLCAIVYQDAQQFIGMDRSLTLEEAFLGAVRHGSPTPASFANVLTELFARVGHLLYRAAAPVLPSANVRLNGEHQLRDNFAFWDREDALVARKAAHTALLLGVADDFRDPVDVLKFLLETAAKGKEGDCFPLMLRGRSHGDLHGRNALVGLVDDEVHWPALFDYEHMASDNLVGWDFVKLETELKVRAYPYVFPNENTLDYAQAVKEFETKLAEQTEQHRREGNWPAAGGASAGARLRTLLLTIRRLAGSHLGRLHKRAEHWLEEYYFLLSCYGVHTGRFPNPAPRERLGAFLSAGVACARYLYGRRERLAVAPGEAEPDFRLPLRRAWASVREKTPASLRQAVTLLTQLKKRYPYALQVRVELAQAFVYLKQRDDANAELKEAESAFEPLNEDALSLRGRCLKDDGDQALAQPILSEALRLYGEAEERYLRAYSLRQDRFPGINVATLRLVRASLAKELGQTALSQQLLQASQEMAKSVLAGKEKWVERLGDDNIWMRATEAEALLVLGEWAEAKKLYQVVREQANHRQAHSDSMCSQVVRLVEAYQRLGIQVQGALATPKVYFAPPTAPDRTI